jgi:dihydroorotase
MEARDQGCLASVIAGGWVLDPGRCNARADVWIRDGRIAAVAAPDRPPPFEAQRIDATGLLVVPGFVDMHVHLREPGFEYKETIATGTAAAVAGGFSTVCCMPNTRPINDSAEITTWIVNRAKTTGQAHVYPIGAVTKESLGRTVNDFAAMKAAGCVAVSDDGDPVMDDEVMRQAMRLAAEVDVPVIDHCEDLSLCRGGCMNEGPVSKALGLRGMPALAEERMVTRDIELARETGARLHIAHISTEGAIAAVRLAKMQGIRVTAEACPHHFALTEDAVVDGKADAKMNPPLRNERDRAAVIIGLADGTIDAIATDHAPHPEREKAWGLEQAPFGIVGLETALALTLRLVEKGVLSLERAVQCLTSKPAGLLGLPGGTLSPGTSADITVVDRTSEWVVDPEQFCSKGRNTPFAGWRLRGRVMMTFVGGHMRYRWLGVV